MLSSEWKQTDLHHLIVGDRSDYMNSLMENQSSEHHAQLAQWLHRLVEILRSQGGSTWRDFVQTVSEKTAVIDLDGIQLRVRAHGGEQLQVKSEYPVALESVNFRSEAETLRDVIAGRLTLDAALVTDKLYLRGNLQDLLGIHQIVMGILADSAINPQLRHLWAEFDELWLRSPSLPPCLSLEHQRPSYGELIRRVPEDVLNIQVYPKEENLAG
ncbi:SCP2 sterol-binding domain-containing protein [Coleofasciculus sp. H7-2]|uniref:SCP2 sterol-binding domain-containing protein n=1 Tax=Coleofasciculus sp. H7-2 TaxID=3351545 RepID=UPI00366BBCC3